MLRINLLPEYVRQRRLTKKLIPLFVGIFLLCVALPLGYYFKMQSDYNTLAEHTETAEAAKTANDALEALAVSTKAKVAPIQAKLDFVDAVHAYTRKWVALYNTLADTSPKHSFIYSGVSVSGATMTIKAYSPSVEEVGRYLQAMYREPDFVTVAVDKIPGYPNNIRHLYYLDTVKPQNLVFADGASGSAGGGGGGGGYPGGGGGGYPGGGGGGYPGGGGARGGGNAPTGYNADTLGPNGAGNIPPDVGPPPAELTGGVSSTGGGGGYPGGGGGGYPGGGGGGQGGGYSLRYQQLVLHNVYPFANPDVRPAILRQALRRVRVVTVPKGFDITVTATLKNPLSPPTYGGTTAAATPGGGGGSPYPGGGGSPYPGGGSPYPGGGYPGAKS